MADLTRKTANLWGYTIEQGGWDAARGTIPEKVPSYRDAYALRCRVGSNVDIPSRTLSLSCSDNVKINYVWIDENGYSLGGSGYQTNGDTTTAPNDAVYMTFILAKLDESKCTPSDFTNIMLVAGSTPLPYEPYGWVHSLRKMSSATETIQSGDTIYANGQPISTYGIKGNTVQNGTPTSSAPISVNGVGNKTANLLDVTLFHNGYHINSQGNIESFTGRIATTTPIDVSNYTSVTFSYTTTRDNDNFIYATFSGNTLVERVVGKTSGFSIDTTNCDKLYLCLCNSSSQVSTADIITAMLNAGSTALPYEPYGYKIPISSGGTTTPVYLSEPLMKIGDSVDTAPSSGTVDRDIQKYIFTGQEGAVIYTSSSTGVGFQFYRSSMFVNGRTEGYCSHFKPIFTPSGSTVDGVTFGASNNMLYFTFSAETVATLGLTDMNSINSWLADQYAAGTPVTVWYKRKTPTTETITAPSIPTTEGANSITVDTTVQPSEFTATWTGWHDSSVKEYDGSDWQ